MVFGRIIRSILSHLSPKEHASKKAEHKQAQPRFENAEKPRTLHANNVPENRTFPASPVRKAPDKDRASIIKRAHKYFMGNRKASAVLIAALITILFYKQVMPFYVVIIFIAAASVSKMPQDFIPFVVGFDLVLFVTVLTGAAYDWKAALVVGPVSSLIGSSLRRSSSRQFDTTVLPSIGYGLIACAIPYIPVNGIFQLGIACTLIYVVMMNILFSKLRPDLFQHISFTVTALAFNYWLFRNFAEPIMAVIA